MKTLSFSAMEILPALLNRTKTQTIRPAWHEIPDMFGRKREHWKLTEEKTARFSVGDPVKFYWKQRSRFSWFCKKCGESNISHSVNGDFGRCHSCKIQGTQSEIIFDKVLGTGKITDVFKIAIMKTPSGTFFLTGKNQTDLAKRDGFNSARDMFTYFNQHHDLSSEKLFWVYRWKWNTK